MNFALKTGRISPIWASDDHGKTYQLKATLPRKYKTFALSNPKVVPFRNAQWMTRVHFFDPPHTVGQTRNGRPASRNGPSTRTRDVL